MLYAVASTSAILALDGSERVTNAITNLVNENQKINKAAAHRPWIVTFQLDHEVQWQVEKKTNISVFHTIGEDNYKF